MLFVLVSVFSQIPSETAPQPARSNVVAISKKEISYRRHAAAINAVAFSADGQFIASSGGDRVKMTSLATGKETLSLKASKNMTFRNVALSPDGRFLAGGQNRLKSKKTRRIGDRLIIRFEYFGEVLVWNADNGKLLHTLNFLGFPAWQIAFSPDNKWLAIGTGPVPDGLEKNCGDEICNGFGEIFLVSTNTWKIVNRLKASSQEISTLAFSPDGRLIVGSSRSAPTIDHPSLAGTHEIFIWETASGLLKNTLPGHSKPINALTFSPDGKLLASAGRDRALKLWDLQTAQMERLISDFTVSYDEIKVIAEQSGRKSAKEVNWDITWLTGIVFTKDKKILASSADGLIRRYDINTGKILSIIKPHDWPIADWGRMNADLSFLVGLSGNYPPSPLYGRLSSLVLSSDGMTLAAGGADGQIRVFWLE